MNKLVRLMGRKLSGSLVVNSTVMSSTLRADASVGMREAVTPTWLGSNCGASCFRTFSTFQIAASALNGEPSWKVTPGRSLKVHFFLSASSTAHSVASPGIMTLGLSTEERSHIVSPSYMVRPVKRLPSKPWSGWPSVRGISAAVMPMRRTVSAAANCGSTASTVASIKARAVVRPCPDFLVRISTIPSQLQVIISYANLCNACAKGNARDAFLRSMTFR